VPPRSRRDWKAARAKCDAEEVCRVCGRYGVEAANSIGRTHDPADGKVRPVDVIPLCPEHHREYDGRRLDLLPFMSYEEQAAAVEHVGIVRALRRLSGGEA